MNTAQAPRRPISAVVLQSLMWLWLISLSVFAALSYQTMNDQADQTLLDSRLQRLEAQAVGLAETIEAIQQRPVVATAADLKDTRERLEARAAQVETTLSGYAAAEDLQALRAEVEQIKARPSALRAAAPAQPRSPSRPTAKPEPPPLPFRIVGAELRAGQRSLSVAPSSARPEAVAWESSSLESSSSTSASMVKT